MSAFRDVLTQALSMVDTPMLYKSKMVRKIFPICHSNPMIDCRHLVKKANYHSSSFYMSGLWTNNDQILFFHLGNFPAAAESLSYLEVLEN